MKFVTYKKENHTFAGILENEKQIIDITKLLSQDNPIIDIGDLLNRFDNPQQLIEQKINELKGENIGKISFSDVKLCSPILKPPSIRDASCFERHGKSVGEINGIGVPQIWYKKPIFYYQNTNCISGPEDIIFRKKNSKTLDYEVEVACIVGKKGINLIANDALNYIFGLTIFNDWSDRDSCSSEVGYLGIHHGKDFASSFGPYIVTIDEVIDKINEGKLFLKVDAWVNDVHTTDSFTDDMYWTIGQLLEYITEDVYIFPGDIIGLGTVGTGCIYERPYMFPYLKDGDTVKITIERLGTLQQYVGKE